MSGLSPLFRLTGGGCKILIDFYSLNLKRVANSCEYEQVTLFKTPELLCHSIIALQTLMFIIYILLFAISIILPISIHM